LAGMLLPALAKARAKARAVTCLSNLKNMGVIFNIYMNDYNSCTPPDYYVSGSGANRIWVNFLVDFEYLTLPKGELGILGCPEGGKDPAYTSETTYGHPTSAYGMPIINWEDGYWNFSSRPVFTVVMGSNKGKKAYPSNDTDISDWGVHTGDSMKDASECTLLADSYRDSVGNNTYDHQYYIINRDLTLGNNQSTGKCRVERRHAGSANLLFADGHGIQADKSNLVKYGWTGATVSE
ncbi:MAG: hypothetical protein J6866_01855, partial [Victivallales bacterium]|nr:hypothetical protein [Victivallales bacterium]